jgi:hypothetical protein
MFALLHLSDKILIQLPNGNDGLPADTGVLHYHGITFRFVWRF